MKILIISDSHGNIVNLKHVMGFAKKINTSAIIHCGDWDNVVAIKTVLEYEIPLYSVLGNADIDPEIDERLSDMAKKFTRTFLEIKLGGRTIGMIHNIGDLRLRNLSLDIIFFGDDHMQRETIKDGIRIVNPGALENDINFAVYETKTNKVEFINE